MSEATNEFIAEFNRQVESGVCGGYACINPDCYCDEIVDNIFSLSDEQLREAALSHETPLNLLWWIMQEIDSREYDYREDETELYVLTEAENAAAKLRLFAKA